MAKTADPGAGPVRGTGARSGQAEDRARAFDRGPSGRPPRRGDQHRAGAAVEAMSGVPSEPRPGTGAPVANVPSGPSVGGDPARTGAGSGTEVGGLQGQDAGGGAGGPGQPAVSGHAPGGGQGRELAAAALKQRAARDQRRRLAEQGQSLHG